MVHGSTSHRRICGVRLWTSSSHPFAPYVCLTGASATGKTTVANELLGQPIDLVVLDADVLCAEEMDTPEDRYARFRSTWLRLASNIHQAGRSTLLVGSGIPEQYANRPERAYVGPMHWMALVCDDAVLEARLRARPAWRESPTSSWLRCSLSTSGSCYLRD
jgi:hypothetical protein